LKVSVNKALKALTMLQLFKEQVEDYNEDFLDICYTHENFIRSLTTPLSPWKSTPSLKCTPDPVNDMKAKVSPHPATPERRS